MTTKLAVALVCTLIPVAVSAQARRDLSPGNDDPARAAEVQQRIVMAQSSRDAAQILQERQRREFENRFSEFVNAMNNFIAQYNSGNGLVWPQREAEKLGKAMRNVQDIFPKPRKK